MTADDPGDPRTRARQVTHRDKRTRSHGCPANVGEPCTCQPSDELLRLEWQGQARMAAARRAAGRPLSAYDRQALDRYPREP